MVLGAVYHTILAILFAIVAILLIIVILLQRGRGVGLSGAFGGAGGGTAFGAKTGDVLTWVTVIGAVALLAFAVILNFVFVPRGPGLGAGGVPPAAPAGVQPAPQSPSSPPAGGGSGWLQDGLARPLCMSEVIFGDGGA